MLWFHLWLSYERQKNKRERIETWNKFYIKPENFAPQQFQVQKAASQIRSQREQGSTVPKGCSHIRRNAVEAVLQNHATKSAKLSRDREANVAGTTSQNLHFTKS